MNGITQLAPHETLELHEVIRGDVVAAAKLQITVAMVQDPELKAFMQTALLSKKNTIRQYQDFYDGTVRH